MIYKTGIQIATNQHSNEEACKLFGHMPEQETKPGTFAELSVMESSIKCKRCGKKLV